eukprot:1380500-Amorphochlora_amoeboformis.AAC.1
MLTLIPPLVVLLLDTPKSTYAIDTQISRRDTQISRRVYNTKGPYVKHFKLATSPATDKLRKSRKSSSQPEPHPETAQAQPDQLSKLTFHNVQAFDNSVDVNWAGRSVEDIRWGESRTADVSVNLTRIAATTFMDNKVVDKRVYTASGSTPCADARFNHAFIRPHSQEVENGWGLSFYVDPDRPCELGANHSR